MTIDKAKALMNEAAQATLRGDVDAVERTETALVALNAERGKEPQPPAQTPTCNCAQTGVRG
jgi:hypothetical protein